jgi:ketosteroid isomerase-like protein
LSETFRATLLRVVILIPFALAGEILSGFFTRREKNVRDSPGAKLVKRRAGMQYEVMNTLPGDEDLPEEEPWPDEEAPESWSFDGEELEELPGNDVIAINEEFYRSLEALNLDRMEKVWHDAEWVTCVHPGGPMLTGWEVIRDSWEQIFKGTQNIRFELADTGVRIENRTAWVTCTENILHLSTSGVSNVAAAATNIFLKTEDGWRLVLHHASAIPEVKNQA